MSSRPVGGTASRTDCQRRQARGSEEGTLLIGRFTQEYTKFDPIMENADKSFGFFLTVFLNSTNSLQPMLEAPRRATAKTQHIHASLKLADVLSSVKRGRCKQTLRAPAEPAANGRPVRWPPCGRSSSSDAASSSDLGGVTNRLSKDCSH